MNVRATVPRALNRKMKNVDVMTRVSVSHARGPHAHASVRSSLVVELFELELL